MTQTEYEKQLLDLRETIRLLMAENEMLAERAEDTLLLSLIAEQINLTTDPEQILDIALEQIAVLKNLPVCVFCLVREQSISIQAAYLTFSDQALSGLELPLDPALENQMLNGACIFRSRTDKISGPGSSLFEFLERVGFQAETLLIIPFEEQADGTCSAACPGFFLFAENQFDEQLPDMIIMLNRVVEMVVDRRNNLFLIQALNRSNTQLQSAVNELDAFSYSVSHDLRAPLRVINGYASILIESFSDEIPAESHGYLVRIQESALRMGQLIDDLLQFSRLGRKPLERMTVHLDRLINQVWREISPEYVGRDVTLILGDLPTCLGDPHLLRQVLTNLLSNAVKFTRLQPNARIEVGYVTPAPAITRAGVIGDRPSGAYFIRDNGVGFDMRYSEKLFGVFQRLHRESEYEGTGVGLAISQRILQRHGGRIWAESAPDQGATFYFVVNP